MSRAGASLRSPGRLPRTLLTVTVAVIMLWPSCTAGQGSIPSRERELETIRRDIAELEQRLGEARQRERGLQSRLESIELQVRLQESRLAEATAARDLAAARAERVRTQVAELEAQRARVHRDLRRRLVGLYRLGEEGYLRLILAAEPGSDVLASVRMIRFLARRDRETLERFQKIETRLTAERAELVSRLEEVEEWARTEEARRRELLSMSRVQRRLVAEAERERRALAAEAVRLAERERKLSAFLDGLYGRGDSPLEGTPLQSFRGVLDWPVEGEVVLGFGPRLDPRYRTRVPHNGIQIATRKGAPVQTVYPGKVLFAAPFQGYGPTAVVQHAGRVLTLYAGFDHLGVAAEDMLSLGQVLGTASDRLYFEIRVENEPDDPLEWLR